MAGLRIVTLNLNEKTYSIERITTPNCLPDSEVAKYATSTYTANGRTVWMRAGLDWNGGENIGGIKLGSRMVSDANNVGGYTSEPQQLRDGPCERLRRSRAAARRRAKWRCPPNTPHLSLTEF
ncbi:MAG: hypothetical protein ACLRM8_06340 [Alistipes sp.]